MPYLHLRRNVRRKGFGDAQCGSGLVATGNPLTPCVYPSALQASGPVNAPAGGTTGGGCISVTDLTSKCGGYSNNCDPHDSNCIANASAVNAWAQNQMYAYGFPNTCIPANISCPNLSSSQQQTVTQDFLNNTPLDLSTGVTANPFGAPGSGVVPGVNAPSFTSPVAPPATPAASAAPSLTSFPSASSPSSSSSPAGAASALQTAQASVVSSSDWLTQSMLGGIPNWGLLAGAGALVLVFMSMGGRH